MSVPVHVAGSPFRHTLQPSRSIHRPTAPTAAASASSTGVPLITAETEVGALTAASALPSTERRLSDAEDILLLASGAGARAQGESSPMLNIILVANAAIFRTSSYFRVRR